MWATWRRVLPLVLAATDPARRLGTAAADAGWLLHRAGRYLRARGQVGTAATLFGFGWVIGRRRIDTHLRAACQ